MIRIFLIALACLILDLGSKYLAQNFLTTPIDLGILSLSLHQNFVLAWGIPLGQWWPAILSLLALALVIFIIFKTAQNQPPLEKAAWGLILGGGLGNLAERLFLGSVTDFIDFAFFPAFNLADLFITVGVALLLYSWFFRS